MTENLRIPESLSPDFLVAEDVMAEVRKKLMGDRFLKVTPNIVIHQIVMNEGGLSGVEKRVLRDLALNAGGREVFVWEGAELTLSALKQSSWRDVATGSRNS